ncbi:fibrinogen-related protein 1 precursor [Elysia marginata]|uniref:Fibrinogen-related protein 1 n=1 Tax=Elysia marginata TaxID=1093978 RepID=A0AAV4JXK8_9GAST|nr:fibrinogen-related protein 1 precursor [Elysia marginata]
MRALVAASTFILLIHYGLCLEITVTPEVIELGITQSFAINCALVDAEEVQVVNMSVSRQVFGWNDLAVNQQSSESELIASIDYLQPNTPYVAPGFESITVQGQITAFESEMGSYIDLGFLSPSIEDLGTYSCQATVIGEKNLLESFTIMAQVSTSNPMVDRLLSAVSKLKSKVLGFNSSLAELAGQVQESKAREAMKEKELQQAKAAKELAKEQAERKLELAEERSERRIEELLASISTVLKNLNYSVSSLEQRFGELVAAEVGEENETEAEDFIEAADQIQDYFSTANSSYFLIKSSMVRDADWAQVACESIGLSLAALDDEQAFQEVASRIGPKIKEGTHVVVSRQRWTYTDYGEDGLVSSGYIPTSDFTSGECVVLSKNTLNQGNVYMKVVPCSTPRSELFYLCEDTQSVNSTAT